MPTPVPGIHHVTAIADDPAENLAFYTEVLGLRLVKRSVNQDDVSVYHLFYADHEGTPGTSVTFFPYEGARQGRVGTGQASATAFLIPAASIDVWIDRLDDADVDRETPRERFGDTVVPFRDPDGLELELVGVADPPDPNLPESPVPEEHAIRGFFGVTLSLESAEPTADLLEEMGFEPVDAAAAATGGHRHRYEASGDLGYVVDVLEDPQAPRGQPGAGTVHHVAFQVGEDDQPAWQDLLRSRGLRPTQIIDRKWFRSVYARTRGGVLFEWATKEPGYTVDEPVESLGERLVLPEWLEDRRDEIEAGLPELGAAPASE